MARRPAWDNYIMAVIAVVVVLLNRETMLRRGHGVTEVLMPGDEQREVDPTSV